MSIEDAYARVKREQELRDQTNFDWKEIQKERVRLLEVGYRLSKDYIAILRGKYFDSLFEEGLAVAKKEFNFGSHLDFRIVENKFNYEQHETMYKLTYKAYYVDDLPDEHGITPRQWDLEMTLWGNPDYGVGIEFGRDKTNQPIWPVSIQPELNYEVNNDDKAKVEDCLMRRIMGGWQDKRPYIRDTWKDLGRGWL